MKKIVIIVSVLLCILVGCNNDTIQNGEIDMENEILLTKKIDDEFSLYAIDQNRDMRRISNFDLLNQSYIDENYYIGYFKGKILILDSLSNNVDEICETNNLNIGQNIIMGAGKKNIYYRESMSGIHRFSLNLNQDDLLLKSDSTGGRFFVSQDEKRFYFMEFANKSQNLYCYNLERSSKKLIAENVNFFDVSDDESFIVFARSAYSKSEFFYLGLSDDTEKSLFTVSSKAETLDVSDSGNYFLYTTYKTGFFDSNRKYQIHVYNLASGDDQIVYESAEFGDVVGEVTWGKPVN